MPSLGWKCRASLAAMGWLAGALVALAEAPKAPPPPAEYHPVIRYRIGGNYNARLAELRALNRFLQSLGFRPAESEEDEAEDPTQVRTEGVVPSQQARNILADPRVRALLLEPATYQRPKDAGQRVKVQVELKHGLPLDRQRLLADQTREFLERVGFREAIGYDHRGHSRLVGTIPVGEVETLLEDQRWQAGGWLVPQIPVDELPPPIRNTWPVEVVEILPEPAGLAAALEPATTPPVAPGQEFLLKIAPELREPAKPGQVLRIEVVLNAVPLPLDRSWRELLTAAAPKAIVEGRLGQVVTLRASVDVVQRLARQPAVLTVRLPRPAHVESAVTPARLPEFPKGSPGAGTGIRLAIIDTDFSGYTAFVGRELPANTKLIDFTAGCESNILPMPSFSPEGTLGHGTVSALAAAASASGVELTLIRIDPTAPFQLGAVAQFIAGEPVRSECLERRSDELRADELQLEDLQTALQEERRQVLDNFSIDPKTLQRREAYFKAQAEWERAVAELRAREQRLLKLTNDLVALRGIQFVANAVVWDDGYPVDGGSALSRALDDRSPHGTRWFQAAGNTRRQVWAGAFRDRDGNGVMEFAPATLPLRPERWTAELNFLAWQDTAGNAVLDLPKGEYEITLQWREPHDPSFFSPSADAYRAALAKVRLMVLRQRDPSGTRVGADDLEVVARGGTALHLDNGPAAAAYEQTVRFSVGTPGRYALRVEGSVPTTIRPGGQAPLPALRRFWELRPRILVRGVDESRGRPIFLDYATPLGTLGMPADAQTVIAVGSRSASGEPTATSADGPAAGQSLDRKPEIMIATEQGTGIAAAIAAGRAAAAQSPGGR